MRRNTCTVSHYLKSSIDIVLTISMTNEKPEFIVEIGTSAGGFFALAELISQLSTEMDAAFFVVMHLSHRGIGNYLVKRLLQPRYTAVRFRNTILRIRLHRRKPAYNTHYNYENK